MSLLVSLVVGADLLAFSVGITVVQPLGPSHHATLARINSCVVNVGQRRKFADCRGALPMGSLSCVAASQQLVLYTGVGASAALSAAVAVTVASLHEASLRARTATAAALQAKVHASREATLGHAALNATSLAGSLARSSPGADKRGATWQALERSSFVRFGVSLLLLLLIVGAVYVSRSRCRHQRLATHDLEAGDSEHTPLSEHKTKRMRPGTPDSSSHDSVSDR